MGSEKSIRSERSGVQYRYYEMPQDSPVLALLGSGWYRTYGKENDPLHFHNYLEIGYCYDGCGKIIFRDNELPYRSGSFSIIPANVTHDTRAEGQAKNRWEYLFIDVETFLNATYESEPSKAKQLIALIKREPRLLLNEDHPEIASCVLQIMDLYREQSRMYVDCAKGFLLALLIKVAMLACAEEGVASVANTPFITRALDYIQKHYPEEILISDIAAALNVSETTFRRQFVKSMNMPPLTYINLVRIEAACKLMRVTQEPIQTIAVMCGFFTAQSFDRNFKEMMGVTPQTWRKKTDYYQNELEKQSTIVFNGWKY